MMIYMTQDLTELVGREIKFGAQNNLPSNR